MVSVVRSERPYVAHVIPFQGALDEAEETFRSQAKILEEEVARKEVRAHEDTLRVVLTDVCSPAVDGRDDQAIPTRASSDAWHHPQPWHGRGAQPSRQATAREGCACELARATTTKRE